VRRKLIQLGTTLILTLCIWGHVSELFDHWDNTFQTGNDIEYSTVIVALIAGAAIGFARVAALVFRPVSATSRPLLLFATCSFITVSPAALIGQSPPPPLRI
jgi:hypothetical protein